MSLTDGSADAGSLDEAFAVAREHHRAGRLDLAEGHYREILARDPAHADALHLLGVLLFGWRQAEPAIELITKAIALRPDDARYRSNLGNVLREAGRLEEAVARYRQAVDLAPELADAHHNLGVALGNLGDYDGAIAALERAVVLRPEHAASHGTLAMLLDLSGRHADAATAAERAVALAPDDGELHMTRANALQKAGRPAEVLPICDAWLGTRRYVTRALALKCSALVDLGDAAALEDLAGRSLIDAFAIAPPAGYADVAAFNRALADHVLAHPALKPPDPNHTTRGGRQTGNIAQDTAPPLEVFKGLIQTALDRRTADPRAGSAHPFWASRPANLQFVMWAVAVDSGGHQSAHIHPSGWLSGVYYVDLPPEVGAGGDQAGWIEFGRAGDAFYTRHTPPVHTVEPRPGLMVTFPSYFYHRTMPFQSTGRRISLAFDLVSATADA